MRLYQFVATCNKRVVQSSNDLDSLLWRLYDLTSSTDPSDYVVWQGPLMVAAVFSSGATAVFQHVGGAPDLSGLSACLRCLRDNDPVGARRHLDAVGLIGRPAGTVRLLLLAVELCEQHKLHLLPTMLDSIESMLPVTRFDTSHESQRGDN